MNLFSVTKEVLSETRKIVQVSHKKIIIILVSNSDHCDMVHLDRDYTELVDLLKSTLATSYPGQALITGLEWKISGYATKYTAEESIKYGPTKLHSRARGLYYP